MIFKLIDKIIMKMPSSEKALDYINRTLLIAFAIGLILIAVFIFTGLAVLWHVGVIMLLLCTGWDRVMGYLENVVDEEGIEK